MADSDSEGELLPSDFFHSMVSIMSIAQRRSSSGLRVSVSGNVNSVVYSRSSPVIRAFRVSLAGPASLYRPKRTSCWPR